MQSELTEVSIQHKQGRQEASFWNELALLVALPGVQLLFLNSHGRQHSPLQANNNSCKISLRITFPSPSSPPSFPSLLPSLLVPLHPSPPPHTLTSLTPPHIPLLTLTSLTSPHILPSSHSHIPQVYNLVGMVRSHGDEEASMVEVEFHNTSTHHAFSMANPLGFSMAALNEQAVVLACGRSEDVSRYSISDEIDLI